MANFYIVENEQSSGASEAIGRETEYEGKKVVVLEPSKVARVTKVESSGTIAQVKLAYPQLFPGNSTGTPAVITEAAYKFS